MLKQQIETSIFEWEHADVLICWLNISLFASISQEAVKTENNEHINLKVAGQDGSVVQFKIKRHTPLIKLMKAYCERQVGTAQYQHTTAANSLGEVP